MMLRLVSNQCLWYFDMSIISINIDRARWHTLVSAYLINVFFIRENSLTFNHLIDNSTNTMRSLKIYSECFVQVYRINMTFADMNTGTEAFSEIKLYQVYRKAFIMTLVELPVSHFFLGWIWRVKRNCSSKSPLSRSHLFLLSLASFFVCVYVDCSYIFLSIFPTIQYHPYPHPVIRYQCLPHNFEGSGRLYVHSFQYTVDQNI